MWRDRDVLRVVAARFISRAGGEAAFFVGIWGKAAYQMQATPRQIAFVMACLALAHIAGSLVAGVLVDRFDPRRVMIGAEVLFVPVTLAVMFATSIPALAALVSLLGLVMAPVMTATASFGPFLTDDPARLHRVNAAIEGAGSASFVIGPGIGAVIARFAGPDPVFIFNAVTSIVAAVLVARVTVRRRPREHEAGHPVRELRDGLALTYGSRGLRYYVLIGTVTWLGFGAFGALEPLFYRDVLHTGVETIGWVNSLFGAGMVTGAWLLTLLSRKVVSARGLAVAAAATGLGALLYVGTADLRVVVFGAIVWGLVIGMLDPLLRTLVQYDSPERYVGRIAGVAQMHRQAGELVPLAVAPSLAVAFGVQPVLIGGGLVLTVGALGSFFEARAVDRVSTRPADLHVERISVLDEPVSPNP